MEAEETRRKIEATVIEILKKANMEEMTEFKVRVTTSVRLGMDLSHIERHYKLFIRNVIESFLLSTATEKEGEAVEREETAQVTQPKKDVNAGGARIICKLSNKRSVAIQDIQGETCVTIREYYGPEGKQLPSAKGIILTTEQWSDFKKSVPLIEETVKKMQSSLRSELDGEQNEYMSKSANQDSSKSAAASILEFVSVETIRFDGKNYHAWATQMELFLKQLKVAYVLTEPCPSLNPLASSEEVAEAKAAEQKWRKDDYICRHNILSCLSDHLYYQYSKKAKNAKGLWEQLKFVYLYEDFGTRRSNVKRYIEYQMVDEKSISEQVQDLNRIADSIAAAGWLIDENFHVSTIISKLPASWKEFCVRLTREENLPFWVLMEHIRVEEESRHRNKQGEPSNFPDFYLAKNHGPKPREVKRPPMSWKRREAEMANKIIFCDYCGKKGHLSKYCRNKKFDNDANGKHNGNSLTSPMPAAMEFSVAARIVQ